MKRAGEPSAGKLHAGFDEEGAGNGAKDRIEAPALWRKPPGTATPRILKLPRQLSTLRASSERLASSAGVSPARVRTRSPVAWMADWRETKGLKPIDKAILGMVSESPGRNESERIYGLETLLAPEAELSP
jgi:hypothetical protein